MTDWIIKTFVPNADDVDDARVRNRYGTVASLVCIVCNVLLCAGKGLVGLAVGSVSIVADAVNNLSDASSNIVSLLGFRLASKPADAEHPYGHGRYEYLSGLVVATLVTAIGLELLRSSVEKLVHPSPTEFAPAIVAVLLASVLVKLWMAAFNSGLGKKIASTTLEATAVDSRNDVITTLAVLAAAVLSRVIGFDLDGWVGLAVGGFVVWSGISLVRETISPLLGQAPDPELVRHIHDMIMAAPGVLGTHDLMVHDYGPGRKIVSAHVEMAAEDDPMVSHDTLDNIEQDLLSEGLPTTLHYDPIVTSDEAANDMRANIAADVLAIDPRLTIHDLRTVPGPTHTNVIFDCVRPHGLAMTDDELRHAIADLVVARYPQAICKITVDHDFVSQA